MKKAKRTMFLYRVEQSDSKGKKKKYLAEVQSDLDESARRKIIHTIMAEGGSVQTITPTDDQTRWPGETTKRVYRG